MADDNTNNNPDDNANNGIDMKIVFNWETRTGKLTTIRATSQAENDVLSDSDNGNDSTDDDDSVLIAVLEELAAANTEIAQLKTTLAAANAKAAKYAAKYDALKQKYKDLSGESFDSDNEDDNDNASP